MAYCKSNDIIYSTIFYKRLIILYIILYLIERSMSIISYIVLYLIKSVMTSYMILYLAEGLII